MALWIWWPKYVYWSQMLWSTTISGLSAAAVVGRLEVESRLLKLLGIVPRRIGMDPVREFRDRYSEVSVATCAVVVDL